MRERELFVQEIRKASAANDDSPDATKSQITINGPVTIVIASAEEKKPREFSVRNTIDSRSTPARRHGPLLCQQNLVSKDYLRRALESLPPGRFTVRRSVLDQNQNDVSVAGGSTI